METSGALAGSLIGALFVLVLYGLVFVTALLSALGIYRAGKGYYKKVKHDASAALYNKTFDVYREYSSLIFSYINLIHEDDNFNLDSPKYKELQEKLYMMSGVSVLIADSDLRVQINQFIEQAFHLPTDQKVENNTTLTKEAYLTQLFNLQKAMRNHLSMIKPAIIL